VQGSPKHPAQVAPPAVVEDQVTPARRRQDKRTASGLRISQAALAAAVRELRTTRRR
jgi:hypothetical protein